MRYDGTETYESWKKRAVQEGYCAVVLEQRYMGSCGQLKDGAPLCARRNTALPALLYGIIIFHEPFLYRIRISL